MSSSSSSVSELSDSTTEACLYTLDPATKKHKRWLDGFLVRTPRSVVPPMELVALFDSSFKNQISCSETSMSRYADALTSGGKVFALGIDCILVQLIQEEKDDCAKKCFTNKQKKKKKNFRGPTVQSPFVETIREVERLINRKTSPLLEGLPRLAVLSTARRTPEVNESHGFVNYWEAAVSRFFQIVLDLGAQAVTRLVARLLSLGFDPSNVKIVSSYAAQRYVYFLLQKKMPNAVGSRRTVTKMLSVGKRYCRLSFKKYKAAPTRPSTSTPPRLLSRRNRSTASS